MSEMFSTIYICDWTHVVPFTLLFHCFFLLHLITFQCNNKFICFILYLSWFVYVVFHGHIWQLMHLSNDEDVNKIVFKQLCETYLNVYIIDFKHFIDFLCSKYNNWYFKEEKTVPFYNVKNWAFIWETIFLVVPLGVLISAKELTISNVINQCSYCR